MTIFWLITIIVLYLAVLAYLGYKGFNDTKNSSDYLIGGRSIHPYVMALSYGATFISTSAIVGFGGAASLFGLSMLWLPVLNIFVGIFIAFVFFGKRTRKMGLNLQAHTFPELLGKRVDSSFIQWFSGLLIFIFMPIYAAAVLIGASRMLEGLLGVPYIYSLSIFSILVAAYVIMGGLKGVMYTDALQGTLMFGGMIFLLFYIYSATGGITAAHQSLTDMASLVPANLKAIGHMGWTASPESFSPLWWIIYSSLVMGVGIGVLAQPQLIVRFMTVKSNREMNRAVLIGGIFILTTVATALIVGALSNVYFFQKTGTLAITVAEGNSDRVIPAFINSAMPSWFGYIFLLVILSAAMSTLSSQFHAIGTSIGRDFYETKILKGHAAGKSMVITRIGIVISIILTVFIALEMGPGIIAQATAIFFGLMASSLLSPYIASLYWKRLTRKGSIAGIFSGLTVSIFCFLFLHAKEAAIFGVSKALFGKVTLMGGGWQFVDPLVIALPVSAVFTIAVSLVTKVESPERVELSFDGIK